MKMVKEDFTLINHYYFYLRYYSIYKNFNGSEFKINTEKGEFLVPDYKNNGFIIKDAIKTPEYFIVIKDKEEKHIFETVRYLKNTPFYVC